MGMNVLNGVLVWFLEPDIFNVRPDSKTNTVEQKNQVIHVYLWRIHMEFKNLV